MNIIYRVREKTVNESDDYYCGNDRNPIIEQNVFVADTLEEFKEAMRAMYDKDLAFRNSKKLEIGKYYLTVISTNAYNAEDYITVLDYTCHQCGKPVKATKRNRIKIDSYNLNMLQKLSPILFAEQAPELESATFCSPTCLSIFLDKKINEYKKYNTDNDIMPEHWIDRESFDISTGYIYMITKKSTGEFYVGQTKYCPVFRWGQHLLTERFDIKNILDYKFEVLEVIDKSNKEILSVREAYWIKLKYNENPSKSLNIKLV